MKTAVASADDESPKKKFGIGLPKKTSDGYGLRDKKEYNSTSRTFAKPRPKKASASATPPGNPKGPKINNKMKVVPLKVKTIADQEREKAKAKEKLGGLKKRNGNKK